MRFNRVFVIVLDSLGIGPMADSARFDDAGADTLGHISETVEHSESAEIGACQSQAP